MIICPTGHLHFSFPTWHFLPFIPLQIYIHLQFSFEGAWWNFSCQEWPTSAASFCFWSQRAAVLVVAQLLTMPRPPAALPLGLQTQPPFRSCTSLSRYLFLVCSLYTTCCKCVLPSSSVAYNYPFSGFQTLTVHIISLSLYLNILLVKFCISRECWRKFKTAAHQPIWSNLWGNCEI